MVGLLADAHFPHDLAWNRKAAEVRWPPEPYLTTLGQQSGPYRAMFLGSPAARNAGVVYRVPTGSVYSSLALASHHEFDLVFGDSPGDNIFPLTGTRWVMADADRWHQRARHAPSRHREAGRQRVPFRPIRRDLWEVTDPLPRAYLPNQVRRMENRFALQKALQTLWPSDAVLVEASTGCPSRTGTAPGSVAFVLDDPDRVVLRVRAAEAGPLVLSDTYYRGWTATVDGIRTHVLRGNLLFRMVCVPAGEHVVEFRFHQPRFYLGLGITVATAIGALLIVLAPAMRDRSGRPH
jgi:Bacterial membrane protein YfhO